MGLRRVQGSVLELSVDVAVAGEGESRVVGVGAGSVYAEEVCFCSSD